MVILMATVMAKAAYIEWIQVFVEKALQKPCHR